MREKKKPEELQGLERDVWIFFFEFHLHALLF